MRCWWYGSGLSGATPCDFFSIWEPILGTECDITNEEAWKRIKNQKVAYPHHLPTTHQILGFPKRQPYTFLPTNKHNKQKSIQVAAPMYSDPHYADSAYAIIGRALEYVTGVKYEEYVTKGILEPLGTMPNSHQQHVNSIVIDLIRCGFFMVIRHEGDILWVCGFIRTGKKSSSWQRRISSFFCNTHWFVLGQADRTSITHNSLHLFFPTMWSKTTKTLKKTQKKTHTHKKAYSTVSDLAKLLSLFFQDYDEEEFNNLNLYSSSIREILLPVFINDDRVSTA